VVVVSERKPTADQQLTVELDTLLSVLDQLQTRLTTAQQQALPTDDSQAVDLISSYEVGVKLVSHQNRERQNRETVI